MKEFNFKKRFGQNFLNDENILNNIVNSANIESNSLVLEIGCGAGALTKKLVGVSKNVIGYEIDRELKPVLSDLIEKNTNLEIIFDDFLKRDIKRDISKYEYDNIYIVSNLPYYITTPIIIKLIEEKIDIKKIVIMIQEEVGSRFSAQPNSKEYNSLSIFLNYYFNIKKLFKVSRNVFIPKPNVDSIVIELSKKEQKYNVLDENIFFKLVKDSFAQKRKTLKNNLYNYDFNLIKEVLNKRGFNDSVRAEQIDITTFIEIANKIKLSK